MTTDLAPARRTTSARTARGSTSLAQRRSHAPGIRPAALFGRKASPNVMPVPRDPRIPREGGDVEMHPDVDRLLTLRNMPTTDRAHRLSSMSTAERHTLFQGTLAERAQLDQLAARFDWQHLDPRKTEKCAQQAFALAVLSERVYRIFKHDDVDVPRALAQQLPELAALGFESHALGRGRFSGRGLWLRRDEQVVLIFRGTNSLACWLRDFDLLPTQQHVGRAHRGFAKNLDELWPEIEQLLAHARETRARDTKLHITLAGHSMGGAMAVLAAHRLATHDDVDVRATYTFGAPKALDHRAARDYHARGMGDRTYHFALEHDAFTPLPQPGPLFRYHHVGRHDVIANSTGAVGAIDSFREQRDPQPRSSLWQILVDDKLRQREHSIVSYAKSLFVHESSIAGEPMLARAVDAPCNDVQCNSASGSTNCSTM